MSEETYNLSETKKDQIQNAYIRYGFPSTTRLTKIMTDAGVKITKEEVKAVLDEQETQQIFQVPRVQRKADQGSLTSLFPFETLQIDIFSLFNFVKDFKGSHYKYAFCAIDIFTRKAWGIPMTKKSIDKTTDAFRTILEEINKKSDHKDDKEEDSPFLPKLIMADQDSSFLGDEFTDLLDKYNITFDTYIKGDHNALGIIDVFASKIKLQIAKYIVITENKETWDKIMVAVIDNYNNTPNTAIDGITPNEAHTEANQKKIFKINLLKKQGKQPDSDLVIGDKVRISLRKHKWTKSSSPQFSDEIYTVYFVKGSNVKLDNMQTYKRYSLLKVVHPYKKIVVNPVKEDEKVEKPQVEAKQDAPKETQFRRNSTVRKKKIIKSM